MDLTIRQATLDDKYTIWRFVDQAYKIDSKGLCHFKSLDNWIWQYVDNPYNQEEPNKLPIWVAITNNEIVGQMCAIAANMNVGGLMYCGGWGCDFIVNPQCRGAGIGHKLTKAFVEHFQIGVGISMGSRTRRIWTKFDPIQLRPMHLLLYPVKLNKRIVKSLLIGKLEGRSKLQKLFLLGCRYFSLHYIIAYIANMLTLVKRLANSLLKKRINSNIQEISTFDNEIDIFSEATYRDYGAIVKRESKLLNWKFFNNKQFKYNAFVSRTNGQLKGYIVLRGPHPAESNVGHIIDLYAAKNDVDTIYDLILHAIRFFGNSISAIQCAASAMSIENVLFQYGFIKIETMKPLVLVTDPEIRKRLAGIADDWFMTLADQDLERVWPR